MYEQGAQWWPTIDEEKLCAEIIGEHEHEDALVGALAAALTRGPIQGEKTMSEIWSILGLQGIPDRAQASRLGVAIGKLGGVAGPRRKKGRTYVFPSEPVKN